MPSATRNRKGKGSAGGTIARAAKRWGVPPWILVGMYGIETSFGRNVAVSSAGAQGPFQFLASTGAMFPGDERKFGPAAESAAHYMHDLKQQYGSWDAALQHYSGGGYGLAEVRDSFHSAPADLKLPGPIPDIGLPGPDIGGGGGLPGIPSPGDLLSFPGEIVDAASAMVALFKLLSDIQTWIRLGEAIAGVILIHMGLKGLSGEYSAVVEGGKSAASRASRDLAMAAVVK
jgi:hypothetical protein